MFEGKTIGVSVPAYKCPHLLGRVVETMPDFIDRIYLVDDKSPDDTLAVARALEAKHPQKVCVIAREKNGGVGAAIASGYRKALDENIDVVVVMAGDAQMDPDDLPRLLTPVCRGEADYTKGNRLAYGAAWNMIPKVRYFGNSALSLLTKIASGYWHVADSQTGYTAITRLALERIVPEKIYPRYGMPNDVLIRLNTYGFRVRDVKIRPVYNVGEKSGIKLRKVLFTIPWVLFRGFWRRMFWKYVIFDFHPLVFFYTFGLGLFTLGGVSGAVFAAMRVFGGAHIAMTSALMSALLFLSGMQLLLFAMWFDMDSNKHLR